MNRFKIDQLILNCNYIIQFISNRNDQFCLESNARIKDYCNQLIESAVFIEKIAFDFIFETINTNGFIVYLKIISFYTQEIANQIKANKIDENFIKLIRIIITYKNLILFIHKTIADENHNSLHMNNCVIPCKEIYDLTHSNRDIQKVSLGLYPGFWLGKDIQKCLKFFNFCFGLCYRLPFTMSSFLSSKSLGENCYQAFKNSNQSYPFSIWHQTEGFFVSKFLNSLINWSVPVKSITVNIPKQFRFRVHYTGKILDFHNMSDEEIESYFNDEKEQERINSTGKRHRNGKSIECRFSFISSQEKVIKSLERIEMIKNQSEKYKKIVYQSARRMPIKNKNQSQYDQVEKLNIYETNDLVAEKLKLKNKKNKFPKYNGPKFSENFKIDSNEFDINKDEKLVLYLHGGGFWTQGPQSCELFLRSMINDLGGIPCLAVHYSLTVPHPVVINELLDTYLWLLSNGEDVKQMLGFNPKQIVLFGDSAGGYFSVHLSIVLNEINKTFNLNIPLPISLLLCYPLINFKVMTPSRTLSALEPLIAFHSIFLILSFHATNLSSSGDFKRIKDDEIFKKIEASNQHIVLDKEFQQRYPMEKNWNKESAPWYSCDYKTYKTRADYIRYMYENTACINLIKYENLDDLKEIDLYTIAGELDFLVDDSIEISRKWKGNVSLDIIDDLMHGYFYFSGLSDACAEASKLSLRRLQEACGLFR